MLTHPLLADDVHVHLAGALKNSILVKTLQKLFKVFYCANA